MNVKFKFFKMGQVLVDRYGNGQENKFNFPLLLLKLSSQMEFPGHVSTPRAGADIVHRQCDAKII